MTHHAILTDRAVLAVYGDDARDFMQGLITNDIRKAQPGSIIFAALLSPQGKFLFDFFITEYEGTLWLEMDKLRLPELQKRLTMYKLRSKVEFEAMPQLQVAVLWGGDATHNGTAYTDPRLAELGLRIIGTNLKIECAVGNYNHHRLLLGIPEGSKDLVPDRSLPMEYGYDELHGIDFNKGCYVGQEVTARTKHRATLRKFIHIVKADKPLPPAGTPVMAGEREAGVMASSENGMGLAHLRIEEIGHATLSAGGINLMATLPKWCATSFAQGD